MGLPIGTSANGGVVSGDDVGVGLVESPGPAGVAVGRTDVVGVAVAPLPLQAAAIMAMATMPRVAIQEVGLRRFIRVSYL